MPIACPGKQENGKNYARTPQRLDAELTYSRMTEHKQD